MTKSRGILPPRRQWTNEEDRIIAEHYPYTSSTELCDLLGCNVHILYKRVERLGVKKAPGFMSSFVSGRFQRGEQRAPENRFKPGQKPWSAGKKIGTRGRTKETQFKPGNRPHNYKPVGTEVFNTEGYLIRKVSDEGLQRDKWKFVHLLLWVEHHGPVPDGHLITFKDGQRKNCAIENLECISIKEHACRHGINQYPEELRKLMQLRGQINRQINKRNQHNEQ